MHRFAMDQGWTRVHLLLIVLVFCKYAAGLKNWPSQNIQPLSGVATGSFGSQGVQSSVSEASVTESIPSEEVASNVFIGESLSSNYESISVSQGLPSALVQIQGQETSDSITSQLQGSSSPSVQDVAFQPSSGLGSYIAYSSPDGSGLQGLSAQLASASTGRESSSVLSDPSQGSSSSYTSDSLSKLSFSPVVVSSPSSQSSSAPQFGGTSSQSSSSAGSSASSVRRISSQLFSPGAFGLFSQSQSISSQKTPGSSLYTALAASPSSVSQSTSSSQSQVGSQLSVSNQYVPAQSSPQVSFAAKVPVSSQATLSDSSSLNLSLQKWQPSRAQGYPVSSPAVLQGSGSSQSSSLTQSRFSSPSFPSTSGGSSIQSQGTSNLYAPAFHAKVPVISQAAPSGSLSQWKPSSSSWSSSSQTSGAVASQSRTGSKVPTSFSTITSAADPSQFTLPQTGSGRYSVWSSQSQSTSSQKTPISSAYAKLVASPLVSQSTSSQGSYSQYPTSSQSWVGSQLTSSSQYIPVQGSSSYSSAIQPQSSTSQDVPTSFAAKLPLSSQASPSGSPLSQSLYSQKWQPSRSQGIPGLSTAVSQGFPTSGTSQSSSQAPSRFSVLSSAGSLIGAYSSSLQSQGTSGLYTPAASDVKVPVYAPAAPSGSLSQWKPSSSRWSSSFQTSGTVASQSSSGSQGSLKVPTSFSTITSAADPAHFTLPQSGSAGYSVWSSQSQSTSRQNTPVSSAYVKLAASPLVSQSTSGQGSYSQYASSSQNWVGSQLAGTNQYVPVQASSSYSSAVQPQTSNDQYAPTSFAAKLPLSSQATQSGSPLFQNPSFVKWQPSRTSGIQTSSTAASQGFQTSGASQSGSLTPSKFSALFSGRDTVSSSGSSSLLSQGTSGLKIPVALDSRVPVYSQAASGSSSLNQAGSVSSGTVSKINTLSQTLSDQRRPGFLVAASSRYVPVNAASTFTDGSSVQLQGASSPSLAALDVKLPAYSQASPGGSLSLSQQSQSQPSSASWSPSGTLAFQGSSSSLGSSTPSRISALSVAASPGLFLSQQGSSSTQSSSKPSFLTSLSSPVAQSSFSSSQKTPSISSVVFRPSKLSQAASGPAVSSQMSPGLVSSVHGPTDSLALLGHLSQDTISQGHVSGQSSDSMSVFSSGFAPISHQTAVGSKPSRAYIESVKG